MTTKPILVKIVPLAFLVLLPFAAAAETPPTAPVAATTEIKADPVDRAVEGVINSFDESGNKLEDTVVPIAAFIFVLILVLGRRYLHEQSVRRRLDILKMMVEKGQPISDEVFKQMMASEPERRFFSNSKHGPERSLQRGLVLTGVGVALLLYRYLSAQGDHPHALALGLIFIGIGVALLTAYKLSGRQLQP